MAKDKQHTQTSIPKEFIWFQIYIVGHVMLLGLNTSLLINSHITIMTVNKSKDQKTSFKEAYMNLLLTVLLISLKTKAGISFIFVQYNFIITLPLVSIEPDCSKRNCVIMRLSTTAIKENNQFGSQHIIMAVLYRNLCFNEACYEVVL